MGVDISWQAFDDEEVERMWSEIPLGELISLLQEDKLFWERKKDFVPEEILARRHQFPEGSYEAKLLRHIAGAGRKDKTLAWIVRNNLPQLIPQHYLLTMDYYFIDYFTYLAYGEHYLTFANCTEILYEARGMRFDINNLLAESMTKLWLSIMRETDEETLLKRSLRRGKLSNWPRTRQRQTEELEKDAKKCLRIIREAVRVFDFAGEHNLPVFADVDTRPRGESPGTGEHNIVSRFFRRFSGVQFSARWLKYQVPKVLSHEPAHTPPPSCQGKDSSNHP